MVRKGQGGARCANGAQEEEDDYDKSTRAQ